MGSLLAALEARERAARARVEALRAEMDRLAEQVAAEEALLGRLEITRQTVVEVLAEDGLPGEDAVGIDPGPEAGAGAAAPRVGMQVPIADRADTDLVLGALEYALWGRGLDRRSGHGDGDPAQPWLLHHSDRGASTIQSGPMGAR